MNIKRFDCLYEIYMGEHVDGEWVSHTDHVAALEAVKATAKPLPSWKEQSAFETWATSEHYVMHQHPLHYLFLDKQTDAARQGWKAALAFVQDQEAVIVPSPALEANQMPAEKERLRFEGDLDKWMKIIGAGITGFQPEAYAVMDWACEELVKGRQVIETLRAALEEIGSQAYGHKRSTAYLDGVNIALANIQQIARIALTAPTQDEEAGK